MQGQVYPVQLLLTAVTWCAQLDVTAMLNCVVRCSLPRLLVMQSDMHCMKDLLQYKYLCLKTSAVVQSMVQRF